MARKKQEIALQQEIETQEEWEEMMTKEGLIVIDVYQEWAGPCKSMIALFRRIKTDMNDDNLHFAVVFQHWAGKSTAFLNVMKDTLVRVEHDKMLKLAAAKADTIDSLERYRGKCEPCFLFYAGGNLVAVVRNANAPLLSKTMLKELAKEHKVLKGEAERVIIRDPMFAHLESEKSMIDETENEKAEEVEAEPREVTVALLKPDIVSAGKAEEVIEKMKNAGIEILKHEVRQLTEDEAKDFYGHLKNETFFNDLVQFMCSGPSHVLLLSKPDSGKGIIAEWRELIGPKSVEDAKANAPNSLRAQYGTQNMINALHGSDSQQAAIRELAFFFPEYQVPKTHRGSGRAPSRADKGGVQRTLALIRPELLAEKKDAILERISEAGFTIGLQKEVHLSKEQAERFYSEHREQPYFEELVNKMTSGPVLALGLARKDAVHEWRKMLGPTKVSDAKEKEPNCLRAEFAVDGSEINMLHGSDTVENADKELNFFFPMQQTLAVIKPDAYENKDNIIEKIKEAGFHVAARKETNLTKDIAQMVYKQCSGEDYYNDLVEHMTSGPTLFMVLTKEDAVQNWRGVIGPTDPAKAKQEAPQSLRAMFGSDIKANAVHGASTEESAHEVIEKLFGDIHIKPDGSVDTMHSKVEGDVVLEDNNSTPPMTQFLFQEHVEAEKDGQVEDGQNTSDNAPSEQDNQEVTKNNDSAVAGQGNPGAVTTGSSQIKDENNQIVESDDKGDTKSPTETPTFKKTPTPEDTVQDDLQAAQTIPADDLKNNDIKNENDEIKDEQTGARLDEREETTLESVPHDFTNQNNEPAEQQLSQPIGEEPNDPNTQSQKNAEKADDDEKPAE